MNIKFLLITALLYSSFSIAQETQLIYKEIDTTQIHSLKDVENPPLAPGCKSKWDSERKRKCTMKFVQNHILRKFNTELASQIGLTGRVEIIIEFLIDINGKVINITATGGPEVMNKHAVEVMTGLPDFHPATKDGETVHVSNRFPVMFFVKGA